MMNELAFVVAGMIVPFAFIFSIYFRVWKTCPIGFIMVALFSLILSLRAFNIVPAEKWIATHLFIISFISVLVMCYVVWHNFKKYCRGKE
ncbi:hypothetical protein ACNSOO_04760 [Aliarcobacter lanthieri]|uniref:hypothetical protein n=1 Tax=Aliarcobacter lanthieri TaxID=1355374 RepID=UPI003AAD25C7